VHLRKRRALAAGPTRPYTDASSWRTIVPAPGPEAVAAWLAGGGEMGARLRSHAWAATRLGPADTWPVHLRNVSRIMLASKRQTVSPGDRTW
jgi:hypothetical protein